MRTALKEKNNLSHFWRNMRVLDIDLDFFLSDTCAFADEGMRPSDTCARAWSEESVRNFLENKLGLSSSSPLPGRIFETHDGALLYWNELLNEGRLTAPFEVTHVDAHTDLGIAQKGYPFVKHTVLSREVSKRRDFQSFKRMGQLNEANYLVFALGARLICRLENIRNPRSKPDLPTEMLTNEGNLRLASAFPALFEAKHGKEPSVEYIQYDDPFLYKTSAPFDFISLAISPRYTPRSADKLIQAISEYMK